MVDWKTQRTPLLPAIPVEKEKDDFDRLLKWRRSMLGVISLNAANVYDDLRQCVADVNDTSTVNMTLANNVLSAHVNAGNIYLDTLAPAIYANTLDSTSSLHGLCPKLSGNASTYLSGGGTWTIPGGGNNAANHQPATGSATGSVNVSVDANQVISAVVIPGGVKIDDLGAANDNTDLNANSNWHGLLPKLSANANEYLAGDGTWSEPGGGANSNHAPVTIVDSNTVNLVIQANQLLTAYVIPSNIALDDLGTPSISTDLDSNSIRHGLCPQLSGNSNEYLDGNGNWTVPSNDVANYSTDITLTPLDMDVGNGTWGHYANATQMLNYICYNTSLANDDSLLANVFLATGTYKIYFFGIRGNDSGILRLYANNFLKASWDLYNSTTDYNYRISNSSVNITASSGGASQVKLRIVGKNANSSDYGARITKVVLRKYAT